ncbi:TPA: GNAT family N-acetyltransferase [Yersinia enterocolitica]
MLLNVMRILLDALFWHYPKHRNLKLSAFLSAQISGQGVARRLMTALLHQANALGLKKIYLDNGSLST